MGSSCCFFRDALDDLHLHPMAGQQLQRPADTTFGRGRTGQSHPLRLLRPVQELPGRRGRCRAPPPSYGRNAHGCAPPAPIRTWTFIHPAPTSGAGRQTADPALGGGGLRATPNSRSCAPVASGRTSAAFRIRSAVCGTRARPCVRRVLWRPEFPWVGALSSSHSAGADAPWFVAFPGRTAPSDFFQPFVLGFGFLLPYTVPPRSAGPLEDLPGSQPKTYGRVGVLGHRGARRPLTQSMPAMVPSADRKTSAPRILVFSVLLRPTHPHRCRRFACPLTGTDARLAEKRGLVPPSF